LQAVSRRLSLILLYLLLVIGGSLVGHWLTELAALDIRPSTEPRLHHMIMVATGMYILAAATPFVPGAEIGFGLIVALGSPIVVLVYASMVAALSLSYGIGRFVPTAVTAALFNALGLTRASDLVLRMAPMDAHERLAILTENAPRRLVPLLLRHRFIALAVLVNLPGNTLIGGGGGIALAAGMSGLFSFPRYAATIAVAVAPIPVLVLLTGYVP
jgi:hypothetical protein